MADMHWFAGGNVGINNAPANGIFYFEDLSFGWSGMYSGSLQLFIIRNLKLTKIQYAVSVDCLTLMLMGLVLIPLHLVYSPFKIE